MEALAAAAALAENRARAPGANMQLGGQPVTPSPSQAVSVDDGLAPTLRGTNALLSRVAPQSNSSYFEGFLFKLSYYAHLPLLHCTCFNRLRLPMRLLVARMPVTCASQCVCHSRRESGTSGLPLAPA